MNSFTIITALLWGICCGYCGIRLFETGINCLSTIHGLFQRRWKSLINKAMPGQIAYGILLDLFARILLQGFLFGSLLFWGNDWVIGTTGFSYNDTLLWIWVIAVTSTAFIALRPSLRKIAIAWKIGHEFDYAQKRQRTLLIRR